MTAGPAQTAELGALSYMEKGPSRPTPPLEDRQRAYDRADQLDTALKTSRDNPRDALRRRTENATQKPEELRQKAAEKLPKAFGTEKNPPASGSAAETRLNNAKAVAERATLLAEKGYDAIPAAEQLTLQGDVIKNVLDGRPAFASLDPAEKKAIAIGMLKDPEAQKMVAEVLAGRMDAEMLPDALRDEFDNAVDKLKNADVEAAKAGVEIIQARVDLAVATATRDEFMDYSRNTPPGVKGAKHDEYVRNMTEKDALQGKIDGRKDWWRNEKATDFARTNGVDENHPDAQQAGEQWIASLEATVKQKLAVNTDPSTFNADETAMAEMLEWDGEVKRIDKFAEELTNATAKIDELTKKLDGGPPPGELQQKHVDALNAQRDAQGELSNVTVKKAVQEQKLVKDIEGTIAEAVNQYVDNSIEARMNHLAAQDQELKNQAKTAMENTLADRFKDRWDNIEFNTDGSVKKREINKSKVGEDSKTLLTGEGPDGILKDMLGVKNQADIDRMPATTFTEVARKEAAQKALNDFNEQMKDTTFADKWRENVAQRVLTRKAQSGKIFEAEIALFIEQPWGHSAMDKMIQNNKDLKEYIDKTYGQIGSPSYIDRVKRKGGIKGVGLLLAALFLMSGVATKSLIKQEGARF